MSEIDYDKITNIVTKIASQTSQEVQTNIIKNMQDVANAAVHDTLTSCGINAKEPYEMQRLMTYAKECEKASPDTKRAIVWARGQMKNSDIVKQSFLQSVGRYVLTGIVTFFAVWWAGIKGIFN